jgi:multisubunit Na+/H+ antiporter MnhB subunit
VNAEYVLRHRYSYMNPTMFVVRAIVYFAIWGIFTYFLNKWSSEQDEKGGLEKRLAALSAPGLILYVFTVTFSSIDWAESLDTDWYSTIWGFLFVAMQGLSTFGFVIIAMALLARREPMASVFKPAHLHDLGKLLLTFVMVWAYFEFAQLVIVWSGNLTGEIPWYLRRLATSWGWLGGLLIVLEFIVPFLLLLSRPLKRNAVALCCVVGLIIVMRWIELMWIVLPSYYQKGFRLTWMNFCVPLSIGCLWMAVFLSQLKNRPLLPVQAPNLERALRHGE